MKKNLLLMCLTFVFAFMFFSCMNVDVNKVEYPKPNYSDSQKQELENYTNLIKENPNDAGAYSMRANLEKNCGDFVNSLNSLHAINPKLLKALNIDKKVLVKGIKKQLRDLKNLYWEELFNKLDSITSRLTSKYRRYLTSDIISQKGIDFTKPNIYNVVLWVLKMQIDI